MMPAEHDRLVALARQVRARAYAPYSHFAVGAALLATDGTVYAGVNVENASYPVGICAERAALAAAVTAGRTEFVAIAVATPDARRVAPCGMCRQALAEFGLDLVVLMTDGRPDAPIEAARLGDLLPRAFLGAEGEP